MKYAYVAFDSDGVRHEDVVDAASETAAMDALRDRGLYVSEILAGDATVKSSAKKDGRRQSKWRCLAEFTRQMAILVSTGTPVVQALGAIERQVKDPRFVDVMCDVRQRVEEGTSLADSLRRHPEYFDAVACSLVSAGEAGGNLDSMLVRLAAVNRQQEVVRKEVTSALSYPVFLFLLALAVLICMLMFVVPRFAVLFESLDAPLPPTTAFLMGLSDHMRQSWWWEIPLAVVCVSLLVLWMLSRKGRRTVDTWVLRLPMVAPLCISLSMARVARILGVLLESRVPLLDALTLTSTAMTNAHYRNLLADVESSVTKGGSMSSVVASTELVSPAFAEAIRSGEESGEMGRVLTRLADYLDEDNAVMVKSITQLLEPVVLIVLGVVIGTLAISMFLPLFDATSAVNTGGSGG